MKLFTTISVLAITVPFTLPLPAHAGGISPGAAVGIGVGSLLLGGALGGLAAPPAYAGGYGYGYEQPGYSYVQYGYDYQQPAYGNGYSQPDYSYDQGYGYGYPQQYGYQQQQQYYAPRQRRVRRCPIYRVPQYDSWGQFTGYRVQRVCQ